MMLREQPLAEFLEAAASASPTPGGGALAALAGALAAAMVAMPARLTAGRRQFEAVQAEVGELLAVADAARLALIDLAEADAQAYAAVMAAMRLPRDTAAGRAARTGRLQAALQAATEVPAQIAARADEVLELARQAAAIANPNALGDVATAAFLAEGAMRAAAVQGELNLASIADEAFTASMAPALAARSAGSADRVAAILATVRRRAAERP